MTLVDVKAIADQAKKEIHEESSKAAVEKLKDLYRQKEKAQLVVRNLERQIDGYLADVADNLTYQSAGIDPTK